MSKPDDPPGHVIEDPYEGMTDADRAFMEEVHDKHAREDDVLAADAREAERRAPDDEDDVHDDD